MDIDSLIFVLLFSTIQADQSHDWNYDEYGPDVWSERYPVCGGKRQSPINIRIACTTHRSLQSFVFGSDYQVQHNFTLKNNGHTIMGILYDPLKLPAFQNGTFEFVNFHLHWSEKS